ncbi:MmcQ/YjbR family DNA-binding protein [Clostridiaceae bacterium]|nr:MmcQ/YjbR family DNA-binding protein [Clostridiaceae bacterium]RKI17419.1 MmcQ/YjbR family DNA-binding protein [bacterium 1XD21-70]
MTERKQVLDYALTLPGTYIDTPFHDSNWVLVRIRKNKRAFAWTYEMDGSIRVNVKVDPEWRDFWRTAYPSVLPGYHQNKKHWNTVILDGSIPDDVVKRMIAESYDLAGGGKRGEEKPGKGAQDKQVADGRADDADPSAPD